jgi:uncharacterized Zn finger protein (UPF0148 family)
MTKRRRETPLGYEPSPALAVAQMHDLVHALNGPTIRISRAAGTSKAKKKIPTAMTVSQKQLHRLVRTWLDSGPDLLEMFKKELDLEPLVRCGETRFYPVRGGRGHLDWSPVVREALPHCYDRQALKDFMILIANPKWKMLGGPCKRCGSYFLKTTKRKKIYCSRSCGAKQTAHEAVKRRREKEHSEKLVLAAKAGREWGEKKRRETWMEWVSREARVSDRWITRAVNRRELRKPQGTRYAAPAVLKAQSKNVIRYGTEKAGPDHFVFVIRKANW